jgi:hypothetical protein
MLIDEIKKQINKKRIQDKINSNKKNNDHI